MYIARRVIQDSLHYILCESYDNGTCLTNRDLVHLGTHPGRFIKYVGGSSFYIDDHLFDLLQKQGVNASYNEVEEFFLPFLDPYVQAKIAPFLGRQRNRSWKPMSSGIRAKILEETHIFDRRRIHYLRFGQIDQRRLDKAVTLYKSLLDKSRDELEQLILGQEQSLSPGEYKRYVFSIFNLQRFFSGTVARIMPHALDEEKVDEFFVSEVCKLDQDQSFWQGMERGNRLPPYLIRYMVMYFDYDFPGGRTWEEYSRIFTGFRQRARKMQGSRRMSMNEASTVFGVGRAELATMSKQELTKIYRKKAHELHPDKGGDHDRFIELTAAYNELLRTRA